MSKCAATTVFTSQNSAAMQASSIPIVKTSPIGRIAKSSLGHVRGSVSCHNSKQYLLRNKNNDYVTKRQIHWDCHHSTHQAMFRNGSHLPFSPYQSQMNIYPLGLMHNLLLLDYPTNLQFQNSILFLRRFLCNFYGIPNVVPMTMRD